MNECCEIWGAVLIRAVKDLHLTGDKYRESKRGNAKTWITSPAEDLGSFLWICDLLGLDSGLVRSRVNALDFKLTRLSKRRLKEETVLPHPASKRIFSESLGAQNLAA